MARRGRPPGRSNKGTETAQRLYEAALDAFATAGYEATTMRDIAREAGVSPGLLYRYYPSKQSLLLRLYEERSQAYALEVRNLPPGSWQLRVTRATELSLAALAPWRSSLQAVLGVLVGPGDDGLFGSNTLTSRQRVMAAFEVAVQESDSPPRCGRALSRVVYVLHLGVVLFYLLDRSSGQGASLALQRWIPWTALALLVRAPGVGPRVEALAQILDDGFGFGEPG